MKQQVRAVGVADPGPSATQEVSSSFADEAEPVAAQDEASIAAPSIQIGELSLTWKTLEVGEGIKPSFAIDDNGVAHVAFLTEVDHGGLFYAHNRNGGFEVETVAEGYFYGPIDLALTQGGDLIIAYHDHQALQFDPALGDEVIAELSEGGWKFTTVAG